MIQFNMFVLNVIKHIYNFFILKKINIYMVRKSKKYFFISLKKNKISPPPPIFVSHKFCKLFLEQVDKILKYLQKIN